VNPLLWLAAQTYLLCLASFIAGAVITALVLRKSRTPATSELGDAEPRVPELDVTEPHASDLDTTELTGTELDEADLTESELDTAESAGEPLPVKATKKSMRYHTPDSPYYNRIKGDVIFGSAAEAEEAGYTAWKTPAATTTRS
jgi:hypothetical protein